MRKKLHGSASQNNYLKTVHTKMINCCEAPRSMLSNYFCKKQVLRGTILGEIWRIQIQIYPRIDVKFKYGASNLKNKVGAHRLGLVVQLC